MKTSVITLLSFTVLMFAISCTPKAGSDNIRIVDADLSGKEIREISLDDLNGLPLEFSEKSIIGNIKGMVQTEYGYIIVSYASNTCRIMHFGNDGKYLRDIGHQGRGPGEYLDITSIFMSGDTLNVASFQGKKLLRYIISQDGYTAISDIVTGDLKYGFIAVFATPDIPDKYIVRHIWNGTPGWTTPLYGIYDRDWNIVDTSDVKYPAGGYNTRFPFSCVDGNVYLAFIGSDTVFKADGEHIVPGIVYDFGKSDFPAEIKYDLVKRLEYFQEHPDDNTHLFHNSTLVTADKIHACMNTAGETLLMVNDLSNGESTFYRILDGDGEPAYIYYLFNAPDGTARGIFMANDGENPSIYDLTSL